MDSLLSRIKQSPVSHLIFAITFFVSGLIINIIQAILFYCLRPISKYLYRKINYYLSFSMNSQVVFMAEWWSGTDVNLYIDQEDLKKYYGKEHGYLIMNHRYEVDWLMGFILCDRVQILGNCKTYAKKSIQFVPTLGWAWKFGESIFLERNWDKDKEIIGKQIRELVNYPDPMWLLLMAEGTRFTPEKHEASLKFAKEKGFPLLRHHLSPRTKGFTNSIPHIRDKLGAIYDVQLAFKTNDNYEPTMTNLLLGHKLEAHLFMQRIPLNEVPESEDGLAQWMHELYEKKDKMADSFIKTGDFFKLSGVSRTEPLRLPRRYYGLINATMWALVINVPMLYYIIQLLISGSTLYFSIGAGLIAIFFLLLSKLIGMSKISKASSYGKMN